MDRLPVVAALGALSLSTTAARALDLQEIQVYQAEVNRPGQLGLELHVNHTLRGKTAPEYEGQIPPDGVTRATLEPAVGVTEWLEVGVYLQALRAPSTGVRWAGAKVRAKLVVPERLSGRWILGLNVEVGRVPIAVEEDGWANELRPILGVREGRFLFLVNPIVGYAFTGPERFQPHFEPGAKAWIDTRKGFALGLEYYAGLGLFGHGFAAFREQEHLALLAFDLVGPPGASDDDDWELNVAFGRGFGPATAQDWLLKTIVGRAF